MLLSEPLGEELERIGHDVVDSAFRVHTAIGPGLLESVYQVCFCEELKSRGISFREQVQLPIQYRSRRIENGLRLDLLIEESIIVELKAVVHLEPVFKAQLLSYLRLSGMRLGFLINFNVPLIKQGIFRLIA